MNNDTPPPALSSEPTIRVCGAAEIAPYEGSAEPAAPEIAHEDDLEPEWWISPEPITSLNQTCRYCGGSRETKKKCLMSRNDRHEWETADVEHVARGFDAWLNNPETPCGPECDPYEDEPDDIHKARHAWNAAIQTMPKRPTRERAVKAIETIGWRRDLAEEAANAFLALWDAVEKGTES